MRGTRAEELVPIPADAAAVRSLSLHADARTTPTVAFHPRAHVEVHERKGCEVVHGLTGLLLGDSDRLLALDDLEKVREPLAAVLWELPQRDLGGLLPSWDDLVEERGLELSRYARTTTSPRWSRFEVTVGENAMAVEVAEVRDLVAGLAARCLT